MSPYEIQLLMHYWYCPRERDGWEPIREETKAHFIAEGLLEPDDSNENGVRATPKCDCYIEALKAVPLPTAVWRVTWPQAPETEA